MQNLSPHSPLHAGSMEAVTGTKIVETSLRELQSMNVSLVSAPSANTCFVTISVVEDSAPFKKVLLSVFDSTYTAATVEATVSWTALGK